MTQSNADGQTPPPLYAGMGETGTGHLRAISADLAKQAIDEHRAGVPTAWKSAVVAIAAALAGEADEIVVEAEPPPSLDGIEF